MIKHFLTFEKNIADLEGKIEDLKHISSNSDLNIAEEIGKLQNKVADELTDTYSNLNPWQKVQVARHPDRPQFQDVIEHLIDDYLSLGGDRLFGNDNALTGGVGYFRGKKVLLLGIDKGKNTNDRILRNFGMARPEGYRKAIRLMELANRFNLPVLSFIDTAGAYPGKGAEERGQAQAIASCVDACLKLKTPMISTILGEGGSGGAIALTSGNVILMFEHSIFSVISPEGCASILWRDASKANEAAKALKLTAHDMKKLNIIDEIIQEPLGGAHRDYDKSLTLLGDSIELQLNELLKLDPQELKIIKQNKYLKIT
ncbi:MAG: acetyl-coenzyme A carboxylase carboxyl transferase subunit alpha [Alphaproteobacteria bacterium]|nr:MAG: acetyl-coenzyme A carboxylase carboxyl transferase subunit alpha [Alphaproteobacteria bacterium]